MAPWPYRYIDRLVFSNRNVLHQKDLFSDVHSDKMDFMRRDAGNGIVIIATSLMSRVCKRKGT